LASKFSLVFSKRAQRDARKLNQQVLLSQKVSVLLDLLEENPFQYPPPYEKLVSELNEVFSRRINRQHRLVYQVFKKEKVVKVLAMWTHYE